MKTFTLKILAADNPYYQGEATSLVVPTSQGQYGILAHHTNMISAIVQGKLFFKDQEDKETRIIVTNGMVKVESNVVLVLVEDIYPEGEMENILRKKKEDLLKEAENQRKSMNEYIMVQARTSRAMSKLASKEEIDYK